MHEAAVPVTVIVTDICLFGDPLGLISVIVVEFLNLIAICNLHYVPTVLAREVKPDCRHIVKVVGNNEDSLARFIQERCCVGGEFGLFLRRRMEATIIVVELFD